MENTAECGEGGWTLAMKINGSKVNNMLDLISRSKNSISAAEIILAKRNG